MLMGGWGCHGLSRDKMESMGTMKVNLMWWLQKVTKENVQNRFTQRMTTTKAVVPEWFDAWIKGSSGLMQNSPNGIPMKPAFEI